MMKTLRFLQFLLRDARKMMLFMVAAGIVAGLSSVGLLAVINKLIGADGSVPRMLGAAFVGLALLKVGANYASQLLLVKFAQDTITRLGMGLCWKIIRAPYRTLETRGAHAILATLTEDTNALAWAVNCLPGLAVNLAIIAGCSAYLAWLSWQAFVGVVILSILGLLGYRQLYNRLLESSLAVREAKGALFGHFRSLTEGIKELMLHRARREAFVSIDVEQAVQAMRESNLLATRQYLNSESWTQLLFYGLIGMPLPCCT